MSTTSGMATHFRGLTEIRGIAALAVLLSHLDQFHYLFGTPHLGLSDTGIADHAVTVFFVLSGFLITFLLLQERDASGTVAVGRFYVRRILRIWPVYYTAFVAAVLLAAGGCTEWPERPGASAALLGFMLPNVAYAMEVIFRAAAPLWSVGVEEQFYLVWPWIVRRRSGLLTALLFIMLALIVARAVLELVQPDGGLLALLRLTRIDCMAFGGILAYLGRSSRARVQRLLCAPLAQVAGAFLVLLPLFLARELHAAAGMHMVTVGAGIIIYNSALNGTAWIRFRSSPLRWLGIISYGIYAYHMLVIFLLQDRLNGQPLGVVALAVILGTVLVAALSYTFMEQRLLKLKARFTIVPSSARQD